MNLCMPNLHSRDRPENCSLRVKQEQEARGRGLPCQTREKDSLREEGPEKQEKQGSQEHQGSSENQESQDNRGNQFLNADVPKEVISADERERR